MIIIIVCIIGSQDNLPSSIASLKIRFMYWSMEHAKTIIGIKVGISLHSNHQSWWIWSSNHEGIVPIMKEEMKVVNYDA